VIHLTSHEMHSTLCGALFYPASDDDLKLLRSIIAGIEAVQPAG